jgi:formylglycine-generating enzyme required for sulfatase activity
MRAPALVASLLVVFASTAPAGTLASDRARVPGTTFETILPPAPGVKSVTVQAFEVDRTPVTNAEFAAFVVANPRWRRDRVARVFADNGYLRHWSSATSPAPGTARQPVTQVSWFAAKAYCESRAARLPTWHEWEWVAAASATTRDARKDPAWRQEILDWYARPAGATLPDVGANAPNVYGIRDVHGLVWEWVLDLGSMMVSADNREQGDPDLAKFCGSGALSLEQKDNYAMLMRIATLSSMKATYTSNSMGFRCAVSAE